MVGQCEVWYKKYTLGSPTEYIKTFNSYRDATKFINSLDHPEHYCIRAINVQITERSFLG